MVMTKLMPQSGYLFNVKAKDHLANNPLVILSAKLRVLSVSPGGGENLFLKQQITG
jgi:hypothetical protein